MNKKTLKTMCARDCYDSCLLTATVDKNGKLESLRGDSHSIVTNGFTCPRGAKDLVHLYTNRVPAPKVRSNTKFAEKFQQVDWDNALSMAAKKLEETISKYGKDSVLLLDYAGNTGLVTSAYTHRLWNALGTAETDGGVCNISGQEALKLHYGNYYGLQPEELPNKDLVVFWGINAPVSSPHMWGLSSQARKKNGAKIVVIDSRESEAAKDADLFFQVKTGSDTALAMGVCRILIEKGWVDHDFIEKETTGFDKWKEAVLQCSPAQVETATGLKWSDVETIARAYKDSPQSATVIGIGLQKNTHGADQVRAVSFIPTLRGLHRGFIYSNSDAYFIDSATINGEVFRKKEPKIVPLVAVGDYIRRGEFKFIFVSGMNPLLTLPDQNALREGFAREDVFVVTHETHWTETCDYSDIVLPAPTFLEKQDIIVPWTHKHFRLSQQVIPAVGESRPEVYVMQQLAHRLKIKAPWVWENPWDVMKKAFDKAFEKGSFKDLMDGNDMVLKCKPANRYPTSSGKMEFYSGEAAGKGFTPLPVHRDLVLGEGEFILLNSATRNYTHSQFRESYGPIPAFVRINPGDAKELGIVDGDEVRLFNRLGSIRVKAEISSSVPGGTLWCPRQLTGLDGVTLNTLTSGKPQLLGNGPTFNSTRVKIVRQEVDKTK